MFPRWRSIAFVRMQLILGRYLERNSNLFYDGKNTTIK